MANITQLMRHINLPTLTYPLSFLVNLCPCFGPHVQIVVDLMLSKRLVDFGSLLVEFAIINIFMVKG